MHICAVSFSVQLKFSHLFFSVVVSEVSERLAGMGYCADTDSDDAYSAEIAYYKFVIFKTARVFLCALLSSGM